MKSIKEIEIKSAVNNLRIIIKSKFAKFELSSLVVPFVFLVYCLFFISNASVTRDDIFWTELSRKIADLNYQSFFGEVVSTGFLRHSILTPILNLPVNIYHLSYFPVVLYVILFQAFALFVITYYSNKDSNKSESINNILIISFVLFRPTFLLGNVFKVWQLTYIIVTAIAILMAFKKLFEKKTLKSLYVSFSLCGLALHFHLSAFVLLPFLLSIINFDIFTKQQLRKSVGLYLLFGNVVIFQSYITILYIVTVLSCIYLFQYVKKYMYHFYILLVAISSMLFLIELKRWSGLSPLTATIEQLPSTGLFFFEQISYYDFPIKFRWISFEVILFLYFIFRKLVSKENLIIEKRVGNSLITMTLLALSALSLFAIKFERNSNPHQWYLVFVIFILYYLAENILKFKKGRIILILLTIWSFAFNLIMQLELSQSRTSHGYYMTTLGERLDLLENLCVRDLNRVNVISTPNSKIAWDFLIKEDSCLKPTDSVMNADVIINERLFPWKQSTLKIDKILNKEEWFSGELWIKRK